MLNTPAIAEPCAPALTGSGVPRLAAANALLTPAVEGVNEWEPTVILMGRDGGYICHTGADRLVWQPELAWEAGFFCTPRPAPSRSTKTPAAAS